MEWTVSLSRVIWSGALALAVLPAVAAAQVQGELSLLPPVHEEAQHFLTRTPAVTEATAPDEAPPLPDASPHDASSTADADTGAGAGASAESGSSTEAAETSVDEAIQEPWYYPEMMLNRGLWSGSVELGLNGTSGNAETMSFRTGADIKHKVDCNTLAITFAYARTQADGKETQNNALLTVRDDWDFCDSLWLFFVKETTEYDEFKAFDVRLAANSGLGYYVVKQDDAKLKVRAGAGASHEIGGPEDEVVPEAVFGYDIEACLTPRQKIESTFEYLPSWADWNDYRMESKMSWAIQLDEAAKLSLKLSVIDRFDSTPEGRKPNDLDYAALLMWKL
jgi:putative salt-induced outer membrane protein YdiY